ncbi:thiopeptide-type bacteriocin biosynthesis protein [Kitasatospora sp. MAP12-15]|uniref:thiopeptide-type bacteriocin biosynthesis protein n=1 Tax=unclassified Kitasatospora TaxID=2633591 RepID=UPI002475BE0B|nr:thiopeptide-type bacteriocin biosynthesis protein [Kitasatospora sp. MAP12-44]MDH6114340.1 thiopeptide-type bacteriocin biosynthesis protein [Kitasatospora sp. MAP12-44]
MTITEDTTLRAWPDQPGWWYARLYPGGLDRLDLAVQTLLPELLPIVSGGGAHRWFFIRYTDWNGPHLRLRVHGQRALLDHLQRELPSMAKSCAEIAAQPCEPHASLVPLDASLFKGRHTGLDTALYEPELDKYGGPQGVDAAELLFTRSSELALKANTLAKTSDRAALTVLLMRASVAVVQRMHGIRPGSPSSADYWERHLYWWTCDAGTEAERLRDGLRQQAKEEQAILQGLERLSADTWTLSRVADWSAAVTAYLEQAATTAVPRTPGHLIFHQNHMMANRLGILPREEALLGIIAANYKGGSP